MKFCYIDESGTPEIPGVSSHYVLAGLSIPIVKWKYCESEILKIKRKYYLEEAEIHAGWIHRNILEQSRINNFDSLDHQTRIYEVQKYRNAELLRLQGNPKTTNQYHQAKKNYRKSVDYIHLTSKERHDFLIEIAKLIGTWDFCRLFVEAIDKIHFNPAIARKSIDEQAFEQVVSRFEQYLKGDASGRSRGLLIHDNNQTVAKKHSAMMKSFHRTGTFWTSIHQIIEAPLFVDSQLTSMVQLADVCSFSIRRYLENNETGLFKEIFKVADKKYGVVVGVRHFTDNKCTCNICAAHRPVKKTGKNESTTPAAS